MCKRDGQLLAPPTPLPATDEQGLAMWQKLMVYASEQARHGRSPLHVALVRRLRESGASGATCLRGVWGFHGDHPPHGDRLLQLRRHVPVVTIIVDTPERIAESFEIVDELTDEAGLVTSEMVPAMASLSRGTAPARRAAPRAASDLSDWARRRGHARHGGGLRYASGRSDEARSECGCAADGLYRRSPRLWRSGGANGSERC